MRPALFTALVLAACVVTSGTGAFSAEQVPMKRLYWSRPGVWDTKTNRDSPVQIDVASFSQSPDGLFQGTYATGLGSLQTFKGDTTPTGLGAVGVFTYQGPEGPAVGKFALKMTDTTYYEKFKGKLFFVGKKGFRISGTYRRGDPKEEVGSAHLFTLLRATKPQHRLGKTPVQAIHRKDLPAKIAFIGSVQNAGPSLLPFGVARMKFTVSPSLGVRLPLVWAISRTDNPHPTYGPGDLTGSSWVEYVKMGALGRPQDRSTYAIEVDLDEGVPPGVKKLHVRFDVESIAPGFSISTEDVKTHKTSAEVEIPILD